MSFRKILIMALFVLFINSASAISATWDSDIIFRVNPEYVPGWNAGEWPEGIAHMTGEVNCDPSGSNYNCSFQLNITRCNGYDLNPPTSSIRLFGGNSIDWMAWRSDSVCGLDYPDNAHAYYNCNATLGLIGSGNIEFFSVRIFNLFYNASYSSWGYTFFSTEEHHEYSCNKFGAGPDYNNSYVWNTDIAYDLYPSSVGTQHTFGGFANMKGNVTCSPFPYEYNCTYSIEIYKCSGNSLNAPTSYIDPYMQGPWLFYRSVTCNSNISNDTAHYECNMNYWPNSFNSPPPQFFGIRLYNFFYNGTDYFNCGSYGCHYYGINTLANYLYGTCGNCSDGIKNRDETGVDCGPICNKSCNPDLTVEISNISELLDEENATIGTIVSELNRILVNTTVELRIDGIPTDTKTISLSGSSQNISFNWLATGGTHNISIILDPLNEINETDETNNIDWRLVNVVVLPDLTLDESDIVWWVV